MPLVIGKAVHSKSLSASFLADYPEHYEREGKGIFDRMLRDYATKYFDVLVSLAKVHRIELGPPGSFDRPASTAEALDRLEQRAGPQARAGAVLGAGEGSGSEVSRTGKHRLMFPMAAWKHHQ